MNNSNTSDKVIGFDTCAVRIGTTAEDVTGTGYCPNDATVELWSDGSLGFDESMFVCEDHVDDVLAEGGWIRQDW